MRRWPCATPRAGAFARAGKNILLKMFGRRLAYDAQAGCMGRCGVVTCGRRPIKMSNEKARGGFLRAGF